MNQHNKEVHQAQVTANVLFTLIHAGVKRQEIINTIENWMLPLLDSVSLDTEGWINFVTIAMFHESKIKHERESDVQKN